jgi:hypothetical protein
LCSGPSSACQSGRSSRWLVAPGRSAEAVEPTRQPPGAGAEEAEHRGHDHAADQQGVPQNGDVQTEAALLQHPVRAEQEGTEDDGHDRGCCGDCGAGVRQSFPHSQLGATSAPPLLVNPRDQEDLVV